MWISEPQGHPGRTIPPIRQPSITPHGEPWGRSWERQICKNAGYWTQIAGAQMKGKISVSPDSCVFPYIRSVQSLSPVWLFATAWSAAHQASLSITNSQSLIKLMSINLVMPSNHLILCCPLLLLSIFPSNRVFPKELVLRIGGQSTGISASASVLPMNIQDGFPLGLTGLIFLQTKGLSRVFSNITVQRHHLFGT